MTSGAGMGQRGTGQERDNAGRDQHGKTQDVTRKGQRGTGQGRDNAGQDKKGTTRDGTSMGQRRTRQERDNAERDRPGPSNSSVYIAGTFLTLTDLQILILIKLICTPPSPSQATRAVVPGFVVKSTIEAVMLIPVR